MSLSELGLSELDDRSLLSQVCHPYLHKLADSRVRSRRARAMATSEISGLLVSRTLLGPNLIRMISSMRSLFCVMGP